MALATSNTSKASLRAQFRELRKQRHQQPLAWQMSQDLLDQLFVDVQMAAAYSPIGSEFPVQEIVERLPEIIWVYPKIMNEASMRFYRLAAEDAWEVNELGISEPKAIAENEIAIEDLDVILVPGVAFDLTGARLGQGGGYYDRCLSHFPGRSVGVAYSAQLSRTALPIETHDEPLDLILTEQAIVQPVQRMVS